MAVHCNNISFLHFHCVNVDRFCIAFIIMNKGLCIKLIQSHLVSVPVIVHFMYIIIIVSYPRMYAMYIMQILVVDVQLSLAEVLGHPLDFFSVSLLLSPLSLLFEDARSSSNKWGEQRISH